MSNKVFKQNFEDEKAPIAGGPYIIQMLFKEPVDMLSKDKMLSIMEKHSGPIKYFSYNEKLPALLTLEKMAEFQMVKARFN